MSDTADDFQALAAALFHTPAEPDGAPAAEPSTAAPVVPGQEAMPAPLTKDHDPDMARLLDLITIPAQRRL
ncbi:hypothetical protein [Sinomonas atrocyanea]|uniref:hypothetical protein n=1 Tax=Sinomonas atrocyanea TaxID=37927 RepID=UPI00285A9BE1|nr:hypothetical protein [Sinomonas atrocyanea]MDR6623044.1 hypothetical protein [Sinomonas atrocyanea]